MDHHTGKTGAACAILAVLAASCVSDPGAIEDGDEAGGWGGGLDEPSSPQEPPPSSDEPQGDGPIPSSPLLGASTPLNDTCDTAQAIEPVFDEPSQVFGTLAFAGDAYTTWCADPDRGHREVVYSLTLESEASARFTLSGDAQFLGALSLRTEACTTDEYCRSVEGSGVLAAALPAGTYWLLVSGDPSSSDSFTLTVDLASPSCGDHLQNDGETCDDGNTDSGDGCSSSCAVELSEATLDTCAGATAAPAIEVGLSDIVFAPGETPLASTVGATDSGTGSCMLQPGTLFVAARDHVRRVRPTADGTLSISLGLGLDGVPMCGANTSAHPSFPYPTGCYDRALHVRTTCDDVQTEVACADDPALWWKTEEVTFPVVADTDYFVFVDGYHDDIYGSGKYTLRIELTP